MLGPSTSGSSSSGLLQADTGLPGLGSSAGWRLRSREAAPGDAGAGPAALLHKAKAFIKQQRAFIRERQAAVAAAQADWRAGMAALPGEGDDSGRRAASKQLKQMKGVLQEQVGGAGGSAGWAGRAHDPAS
jgi:hypothetical protein